MTHATFAAREKRFSDPEAVAKCSDITGFDPSFQTPQET
jgi:hypothetical protein